MRVLLFSLAATGLSLVAPASAEVGLEGYCPVCVVDGGKWMIGNPEITAGYDGRTYQFPDAGARDKFVANPTKYVPALDGDCIVCFAKHEKRVLGSVQHAATYKGRLFLFPGAGEKQMFLDDPAAFASTDVAADGNCIVCKVKAGKEVPGSTEFTAIHDGLRYLFPSDAERQAFLASPEMFAAKATVGHSASMTDPKPEMTATSMQLVSVEGRSGCAACEFRVHPTKNPDQLGLAVKADDGSIYVVEGAHSEYAGIYKDRFDQVRLSVSGKAIKKEGNVTWLEPVSVARVN